MFDFQNLIYRPKYGTTMGSPVSVTMANLVMEDVENRAMETYHTKIPVWKRYVDDAVVIIQEDLVGDFNAHHNSVEKTIKFIKQV